MSCRTCGQKSGCRLNVRTIPPEQWPWWRPFAVLNIAQLSQSSRWIYATCLGWYNMPVKSSPLLFLWTSWPRWIQSSVIRSEFWAGVLSYLEDWRLILRFWEMHFHKRHVTLPMECQYAWRVCKVIVLDCFSRLSWIALMCTHTYKRNVTLHYVMMYVIVYKYMWCIYIYIHIVYTSHHMTTCITFVIMIMIIRLLHSICITSHYIT